MSDFEILFWVMQGLACLWFTYQAGRFIGRKEGFDIAIGIIDEDLRKIKKALEGKV